MSIFCFICILLSITLGINDPELSNYFIGEFDLLLSVIPVPYAPGYCVKDGLAGSYVEFECSLDKNSITKKFYGSNDDDCSGAEDQSKRETYNYDSNIEYGDLNDLNCNGKDNSIGYITYLNDCNNPIGIAWLATDICFKYLNFTNITGNLDNYPDAKPEEYYQLSQMNMCDGCDYTFETYVGEQDKVNQECPNKDKPLTRFTADPGCDFFFQRDGFKVYADMIACVKDGIDSFSNNTDCDLPPVTTGEDTDNVIKINTYCAIMITIFCFLVNMLS